MHQDIGLFQQPMHNRYTRALFEIDDQALFAQIETGKRHTLPVMPRSKGSG